ncbi:MAG: chromosome segregation protein SMC [candidate division Zixibacteria bacterium]|nr:chromosome segregation protein SMC [candidate division Zixibacteria bacterium]
MYLKRLDILGFKSFANKTAIQFSQGVTAVVGPNGCGKTNILDALRWVLGEQRTSMLRGNKMEEIIFNGTRDVKPLGMSEVSLTLINNRGILPTEYGEVQVTRRLFRSGESEYLLNKIPCRLKDITELFYDTGVGARSYSVIQQDMIEAVISDKAEERRFLFEEAAGITKYKQRKKAALRKLEATEADFLRLKDIYSEVQTQVRSLKRQQKKAERYQSVADNIKNWELYLSSRRMEGIQEEKREINIRLNAITDAVIETETSIEKISAQLEGERSKQADVDQKLTGISSDAFDITEQAHNLENKILVLSEKRSNARTLCERNDKDIHSFHERTRILSEQTIEAEDTLKKQQDEISSLESDLQDAQKIQAEADQRLLEERTTKESENQKLLELEGKLSSEKTDDENLREQKSELTTLAENLNSQHDKIRSESALLTGNINDMQLKRDSLREDKISSEEALSDLTNHMNEIVEQSEEVTVEISNLAASIEACQARRNLLEEMIIQYEGYESGVIATMEMREHWQGITGTVAEKFVPAEGMETATEAALGEIAGYIICDNRKTAEEIISFLKSEKKGKIGLLVPTSGMLNPVARRPELDLPEFVGWLNSYISTDENLRPLMETVLSRTAVFKAGSDPTPILERLPYGFSAVSTDGVLYNRNAITGGSDDKFPLFRRQEKVAEQETALTKLTAKSQNAQERKNSLITDIAATRAKSEQLSETTKSLDEQLQSLDREIGNLEYQYKTAQTEMGRLARERQTATNKLEHIRNRQLNLGLGYNKLLDKKKQLVSAMSDGSERLAELESDATSALEHVSQFQISIVESRSKIEQTKSKLSHIRELRDEIVRTIDTKKDEIRQARSEIDSSADSIAVLEKQLKEVFEKRKQITHLQNELQGSRSEMHEQLSVSERDLKKLRLDRETLNDEKHQIEIRLTTFESELGALLDRIRQDYELDLSEIKTSCPDDSLGEAKAREYLTAQKEQLKKYGVVNLLALEEYKSVADREKFLNEQLTDLENAQNDLIKTISKINQTARKLFNETFEKVQSNFKKLFVELFSGGEASIKLLDPDNPLESDIDIIARPRGKKLLSITMMSGGERALTAISLLFSLYLVKPSPFCILDEIDAPLDDANCRRFLKILDKFSDYTQFVAITHNKITMEAANNIYGVTMEQPGISQLVAVRFTEDEDSDKLLEIVHHDETTTAVDDADTAKPTTESSQDLPKSVQERIEGSVSSAVDPDKKQ